LLPEPHQRGSIVEVEAMISSSRLLNDLRGVLVDSATPRLDGAASLSLLPEPHQRGSIVEVEAMVSSSRLLNDLRQRVILINKPKENVQ